MQRKLAAILSADVKGYSRLMRMDELRTIQTLTDLRTRLAQTVESHRGRVVDMVGDNLLADFASAVDAVQSAVEFQNFTRTERVAENDAERMEFRIGINVGDVLVDGDRLYGDGVNIAARLEALSQVGGICISSSVYEQIEGKLRLAFRDLGEQNVKNITRPIRAYQVLLDTDEATTVVAPALPPVTDKPSLVVLPFANLSGANDQEYFSDGITEDLITDLSKISGLFVIARNSAFGYKGSATTPAQLSAELGVRYLLEGSVRKAGNRVRVTAQLVDASNNHHLWSERYDRELTDIFAVQDDVTQQIVAALKVALTPGEHERIQRMPTRNLQAYDCYLRALEYYARRTEDNNLAARAMAKEALTLDPAFASAHALLGRTFLMDLAFQWGDTELAIQRLKECAESAVALDNTLASAHETLAFALLGERRHDEALTAARRAIALDPNSTESLITVAEILNFMDRSVEAVPVIEHAMRLNPKYPASYLWVLGQALAQSARPHEAIETLTRTLTRNPDHLNAHMLLAVLYVETGELLRASAEVQEMRRINPRFALEYVRERAPYAKIETVERLVSGLQAAGLMDGFNARQMK